MGNEQSNLLPKSSQARKKPPQVLIGRKERMQAQRCIILATALHSLANVQDNYKFSDREILSLGDLCIPIQSGAGRGEEGYKKRQTETATKPEKKEDREREITSAHTNKHMQQRTQNKFQPGSPNRRRVRRVMSSPVVTVLQHSAYYI